MKAKQEQKGRVGIVAYIEFDHVSKLYGTSEVPVRALDDVSFSVQKGEFCVLLGSSGAGKTTLLNLLGGMDTITSGSIFVDGSEVSALNDRRLVDYRRHDVGFVFQFYNLIPNLTALENIEIAAQLCKDPIDAMAALSLVGLKDRGGHFPAQLSGGEQQRVAIARALAKNPKLLLCDEPTGALDYETGKGILKLLHRLSREHHTTVMIIFKNDISIVSGIADLFPLFFALIAMLVCVTTMTRVPSVRRKCSPHRLGRRIFCRYPSHSKGLLACPQFRLRLCQDPVYLQPAACSHDRPCIDHRHSALHLAVCPKRAVDSSCRAHPPRRLKKWETNLA